MRKRLILTFVLLICLTSIQTSTGAGPKAGTKCSKVGVTQIASGKKFICLKVGNSLKWKSSASLNTSSPAASPLSSTKESAAGEFCKNLGESITNSKGHLECREVANNKLKYFQLSRSVIDLPIQESPLNFSTCRVSDQRAIQPLTDNYAIAYPIKWSPLKRLGSNKVLFIPFDFSDHPGTVSPEEMFGQDIRKFKEWVSYYSNGKFRVDVETSKTWIRASQPSKSYESYLGHANSNSKTGFEMLMKDAESIFDYSAIDAVILIFPSDLETFKTESTYKAAPVKTNKGTIQIGLFAMGKSLFNVKSEIWFWLTHEILHSWGLKQHAPAMPATLSINTGSAGPGQSLISWDAMIMDWINPENIWCSDLANLNDSEVTLSPLEREQNGVKGAMVKLTDSRVLVMESHRNEKWGKFSAGTYGVTAYIVDTRFDTDRSGEYAGVDDFTGKKFTRAANYIEFPLNHGQYRGEKFNNATGESWGIQNLFSKNYFLYEGESFTFDGVTVKLTKSGDNDTIRISRN